MIHRLPQKMVEFIHSDEFLAIKFAVEFVTCFAIVLGVIHHW